MRRAGGTTMACKREIQYPPDRNPFNTKLFK